MSSTFQSLRGFHDLLPADLTEWRSIEETVRSLSATAGYEEIRTPVLEPTELFTRGVGAATDIVGKEMYSFTDRSGDGVTLRPEMTASVVRAFIEHSFAAQEPISRFYYIAPLFRQERPQAGRLRQFHQFGVENFGSAFPEADVEVIALAIRICKALGIETTLRLNSIGDHVSRAAYRTVLIKFLEGVREKLSEESVKRIATNPLRVLDSKDERDIGATKDAPVILEYLNDESREHFSEVQRLLGDCAIPFTISSRLVRGLDYYSKTVFELSSAALGSQDALAGGGRYDYLVEELGGKPTPAIGFAMGIERAIMARAKAQVTKTENKTTDAVIVALGDAARRKSVALAEDLRQSGLSVVIDLARRSAKAQMREANKRGARYAVIIGDDELASGSAAVKHLTTSTEEKIPFERLSEKISTK